MTDKRSGEGSDRLAKDGARARVSRSYGDFFWASGSLATARGLSFVAVLLTARALPLEEFAIYLLAVAASVIAIPTADAGMWPLITREAARRPDTALFALARWSLRVRLPYWSLATAVCIGVIAVVASDDLVLAACVLLAAFGQAILDALCAELAGRSRFRDAGALRTTAPALSVLATFPLFLIDASAVDAMVVFAAARAVPALVTLAFGRPGGGRPGYPEITVRRSLPFGLSALLVTVYTRSDIILLSAFGVPAAIIAAYGVTYNIVMALQLLPAAFTTIIYPRVAAETHAAATALVRRTLSIVLPLAVVEAAIAFGAARLLLGLFGPEYVVNADEVSALLLLIIPVSLSAVLVASLQGRDSEKRALVLLCGVTILNVSGNAALIPVVGYRGSLAATSVAEWAAVAGAFALAPREWWSWRDVLPCLVFLAATLLAVVGGFRSGVLGLLLGGVALIVLSDSFGSRSVLRDAVARATNGDSPP